MTGSDPQDDSSRLDEILANYMLRVDRGEKVDREAFIAEHPGFTAELNVFFEDCDRLGGAVVQETQPTADSHQLGSSHEPRELGDYVLLERIGQGGMGVVYRAKHKRLEKTVAVKVLAKNAAIANNAISRFEREMRAVAALEHPNIVRAYDAREVDGTHFLAMEYVDGCDLSEIVRRHGQLTVPNACEVVRQTALALQCAHDNGQVHRDVKPSNLMLTQKGTVKLLDLGLSRATWQIPHDKDLTCSGQIVGTSDFVAPEQIGDSRTVDIRADIYSLGCTLFTLLAGRPPFCGPEYATALEKLHAHAHEDLPSVRELCPAVPEALDAVLGRMVAKAPDERFAVPRQVVEAMSPFVTGANLTALMLSGDHVAESTTVPVAKTLAAASPKRATRRTFLWVTAAVAIAAAIGIGIAVSLWPHSDPVLKELLAWVRRGQSDDDIELWRWKAGELEEPPSLEPLFRGHAFKIKAIFDRPTHWCLVWIDTRGKVEVTAKSVVATDTLDYPVPADELGTVSSEDPLGLHLLLVLTCDREPSELEDKLLTRLAGIDPPPARVRAVRGAGDPIKIGVELGGDYADQVRSRLPSDMHWISELHLPTTE